MANEVKAKLMNDTVLFYGEMGVGKTTFIKALAKSFGCKDTIQSPTYSIVNEYEGEEKDIYHFDLYRINNELEALDFGFEGYLDDDNIILIEWPEKVLKLLPENVDLISLKTNDNASRTLKLSQNINLTKQKLMTQQHFS